MIENPALGPSLKNFASDVTGIGFFAAFLPKLVALAFVIGVIVFFFVFITGAITWIMSGKDKNALEEARTKITNGLVGLIILFASYAIIGLIETFFGINILELDIAGLKI